MELLMPIHFGLFVDPSLNLAWYKPGHHLNFSLLSYLNKDISKMYGPLCETPGYGNKGFKMTSFFD
jgi:hypothetical protein